MCRYLLRPPLSKARLNQNSDGTVVLEMKRTWSDGTRYVLFSPEEFVEKLAALIPPPFANQTLYFGVLAPNAAWRADIIPKPEEKKKEHRMKRLLSERRREKFKSEGEKGGRDRRKSWSELLWRVFGEEGWTCPRCGKEMLLRCVVQQNAVAHKILQGLGGRGPP